MAKKVSHKTPPRAKKLARIMPASVYLLLAFAEGAAVIAVELLGAKMLHPYFGNSLPVWTTVIGITIGFLTIGYFIGGFLSKSKNRLRLLAYAFALASLFIIIMPLWARQLFLLTQHMSLYAGCTITALLLLGPPLLFLGTTSPLIIQQITQQVQYAGKSAGRVYAVSTLGGILFTFLFGFLIIPHFGISSPLVVLSLMLLVLSFLLFFEKKLLLVAGGVLIFLIITIAGKDKGDEKGHFRILHNSEGVLGQLKVIEGINPDISDPVRYLLINGVANTYMICLQKYDFGYSGWMYVHKIAMIASMKRNADNALLMGFGAGTIATELQNLNMHVDAVDYDSRMLGLARKYFFFHDTATTYIVDDARHYLRTVNKKYDLVIFDVLNSDTQPSYIFTTESLNELKNILADKGMVIIEFQEFESAENLYVTHSICNTLLAAGFKAYLNIGDDMIIVASLNDLDLSALSPDNFTPCCKAQHWSAEFIKKPFITIDKPFENGMVLTDDRPNIDVLNAESIKKWRLNAIESYASKMLNTEQEIFK